MRVLHNIFVWEKMYGNVCALHSNFCMGKNASNFCMVIFVRALHSNFYGKTLTFLYVIFCV